MESIELPRLIKEFGASQIEGIRCSHTPSISVSYIYIYIYVHIVKLSVNIYIL